MKVAICDLNYYDSNKHYHLPFKKNNLTIKVSSSLNAVYIIDKKTLWCFMCLKCKYLPHHRTCFNQFFLSVICYILRKKIFIIFLLIEPSNDNNVYLLAVKTHIMLKLH